jgi:1-acyl-sn-glycerol-3-phosphate acyltransferase
MLYRVVSLLALIACKVLFRLRAQGLEYIPRKGGFILASNHISYLDPIVLGAICPRKLNFMAKQELFCHPLISWFLSQVGAFPVKRDSADLSSLKYAMRCLKEGKALILFPEGSRRFDSASTEPYAGIGFLTAKLYVPVIPVFIEGTEKALPAGAKFIRPAKISVHFGKQISIERRVPYQDVAKHIMENIRHLSCGELN